MVDFNKQRRVIDGWNEPVQMLDPISVDRDGFVVVGTYRGASVVEVKAKEDDDPRESTIHTLTLRPGWLMADPSWKQALHDGDDCRFWGSYDLDQKLRRVSIGEMVRIEYLGKEALSGGRDMKVFDVRTKRQQGGDRGA